MRLIIYSLFAFVVLLANNLVAQTESVDEIYIEDESIETAYRAKANPYVFIRSKKGKSGVTRTPEADAAIKYPVTKIVLVFTEVTEEEANEREDDNYARWGNLFTTYPEFFQNSNTEYVSICQCNAEGDIEKFRQVQGFYVYFEPGTNIAKPEPVQESQAAPITQQKTEVPAKAVEPETPKRAEAAKNEPEPKSVPEERVADKKSEPKKKAEITREPEPQEKVAVTEPEPKKATTREPDPVKEQPDVSEEPEETAPVKPKPAAKKTAANKPRRALDPRACRPACYGYGDEDLNIFFAENVKLSKKQKKKAKKAPVNLTLQLNPDGTIKKAMVQGPNPELNQLVQSATESMNPWNSAVKGGVAVKSQVKMILKLDPGTKALKPSNIITNPRPSPKCKCVSDEEIFGSN